MLRFQLSHTNWPVGLTLQKQQSLSRYSILDTRYSILSMLSILVKWFDLSCLVSRHRYVFLAKADAVFSFNQQNRYRNPPKKTSIIYGWHILYQPQPCKTIKYIFPLWLFGSVMKYARSHWDEAETEIIGRMKHRKTETKTSEHHWITVMNIIDKHIVTWR